MMAGVHTWATAMHMYMIKFSLCLSVEHALLVQPQANSAENQTHSGLPKCPKKVWKVDALNLPWENMDSCTFLPVAILGQVVTKVLDHGNFVY